MKKILIVMILMLNLYANDLNFKTLKSDFTQSIKSNNQTINYTGNFTISEEGAVWIYKKPTPKKIYFKQNQVLILDESLEQVIITKTQKMPKLSQILKKAEKIEKNLYKAKYEDIKYLITIKNSLPFKISYTDKLDNNITITLKNTIKDEPVSKQILTPVIPENYDIITG